MIQVTCQICEENQHKYKCPACEMKYCSVPCYKKHKEECVPKQRKAVHQKNTNKEEVKLEREDGEISQSEPEMEVDEDRVSTSSLQLLGQSDELKSILENRHLRNMITSLDSSKDPATDIASAMHIPIFSEFADTCLSIVEPTKPPDFLMTNHNNKET